MDAKRLALGASMAFLLLFGQAGTAAAEDGEHARGLYFGGSAMWSFFDIGGDLEDRVDFDEEDDFGWATFVGYRACDYFAVEGGYIDLGQAKGNDREDSLTQVDAEVDGFQLLARGFLPILQGLAITGTGGMLFYDADADASSSGEFSSNSESDQALSLSGGLEWNPAPYVSLRAEYERFFDIEDIDVNTVLLSIVFHQWERS